MMMGDCKFKPKLDFATASFIDLNFNFTLIVIDLLLVGLHLHLTCCRLTVLSTDVEVAL